MLNQNLPNNAYNEFWRIFGVFAMRHFQSEIKKIKRNYFNSPWMTKALVKSSKRNKDCMKKSRRIGTLKKNWIINNKKHFLNLWKRNQRKTTIQILLIHANIKLKIRGMLWKKLSETKESLMPLFPVLSRWKTEKCSTKKKLQKHLLVILLISAPT